MNEYATIDCVHILGWFGVFSAISKGFVIPYDSSFNADKVTQKDTCISHMPAHTYTPHPKLNNIYIRMDYITRSEYLQNTVFTFWEQYNPIMDVIHTMVFLTLLAPTVCTQEL